MTTRTIKLTRLALLLGVTGIIPVQNAHAALLNVVQTFPDITLGTPSLIYDNNGGGAGIGQLKVIVNAASLNEGAAAGGTSDSESYISAPPNNTPNLALTINVNNVTGAFVSGSVAIGFGDNAAEPQYAWNGTITNFGFNNVVTSGRIFDATWTVTSDSYANMPGTLSQFVNGYLTGGTGGIIISSSAGFNDAANFANDWIIAANPNSTLINSFIGGLSSPVKITSTVTSDVFATPVPEASTYGMMLAGLAMLAPLVRRKSLTR
ncbi:MAG: hypothetical protein Q8K12_02665 [Thiobacillus sp.]|nr:hypothetical protein [Thiobacillus sp.]